LFDFFSYDYNIHTMSNKKDDFILRLFATGYFMMNGFAVGRSVVETCNLVEEYSHEQLIILMLWLGLSVHTGRRAFQVLREIKNNQNDNQKKR